jgi:hypothetical protein
MAGRTITMPEATIVALLKTLPEDILIDIFWKTVVESDVSPLTRAEKKRVENGKKEFIIRETAKWEDLR